MRSIKFSLLIILLFTVLFEANAQSKKGTLATLESVFFVGEHEQEYEKLVVNYKTLLFTVADNDMNLAFDEWTNLMKDIEAFSTKSNIDIKGVKVWINVFWSSNGNIDYIVFHPKPDSKNMDYEAVRSCFANFIKTYQSPLKYSSKFSHYGSANFPIFSRSLIGPEK